MVDEVYNYNTKFGKIFFGIWTKICSFCRVLTLSFFFCKTYFCDVFLMNFVFVNIFELQSSSWNTGTIILSSFELLFRYRKNFLAELFWKISGVHFNSLRMTVHSFINFIIMTFISSTKKDPLRSIQSDLPYFPRSGKFFENFPCKKPFFFYREIWEASKRLPLISGKIRGRGACRSDRSDLLLMSAVSILFHSGRSFVELMLIFKKNRLLKSHVNLVGKWNILEQKPTSLIFFFWQNQSEGSQLLAKISLLTVMKLDL